LKPATPLLSWTGVRSASPKVDQHYLRSLGRISLLLLLACFSLGGEEAEQEFGGLHGTKSGPESHRRGRISRITSAAQPLCRAAGGMGDTGDTLAFEAASVDFACHHLAISDEVVGFRLDRAHLRLLSSGFNRGPPSYFL
jgi:hypothetical protein